MLTGWINYCEKASNEKSEQKINKKGSSSLSFTSLKINSDLTSIMFCDSSLIRLPRWIVHILFHETCGRRRLLPIRARWDELFIQLKSLGEWWIWEGKGVHQIGWESDCIYFSWSSIRIIKSTFLECDLQRLETLKHFDFRRRISKISWLRCCCKASRRRRTLFRNERNYIIFCTRSRTEKRLW